MLTAGSFKGDTQELENRVADLQEEVKHSQLLTKPMPIDMLPSPQAKALKFGNRSVGTCSDPSKPKFAVMDL